MQTFVILVSASVVHDPHGLLQPKGADRKQKTDREKMEKRTPQEKEKYQPSYETTILTEVSILLVLSESQFIFLSLIIKLPVMFAIVTDGCDLSHDTYCCSLFSVGVTHL